MGGGGIGGLGGGHGGGGASNIEHPKSASEFTAILQKAGAKPVCVDFFTTWCGPCKRIAPAFEELAKTHAASMVFVKVDGDVCRDVCAQKDVKGFPTFQFYSKGVMVESFSGADENRLRSAVSMHAANFTAPPPCPYKHFPLRDEESTNFPNIKWPLVEEKIKEVCQQLKEAGSEFSLQSKEDTENLEGLLANLKNKGAHHKTPIPDEQLAILDKMLQWPGVMVNHALHVARMTVMHPHAAKTLAARAPGPIDLVSSVCKILKDVDNRNSNTAVLALQTMCNMFSRRALAKFVTPRSEEMVDCVASITSGRQTEKTLMVGCLALLINFAIVFLDPPSEDKNRYESAKVHMLSNMVELLSAELDSKLAYRACVVVGTLIFRDAGSTEIAQGLELPELIAALKVTHSDDAQLKEICEELSRAFADPSK